MGVALAVGNWVRQFSLTIARGTHGPEPQRLQLPPPLKHAIVPFGFPRQVSSRPRSLFAFNFSSLGKGSNTRLCGARPDANGRSPAWLVARLS
jgi:hypothetical protein